MPPRRYAVYVESRDRFSPGVNPELAKEILCLTRERLRPFLGPLIVARDITPFRLPPTDLLDEHAFLPPDDKAILLTTKSPMVPDAPRAVGAHRTYRSTTQKQHSYLITQVAPSESHKTIGVDNAASVLAHEVCHDYGIGHCAVSSCLMAPTQQSEADGAAFMKIPNPFCSDHRDELAAISHLPKVPLTSELSPSELLASLRT